MKKKKDAEGRERALCSCFSQDKKKEIIYSIFANIK